MDTDVGGMNKESQGEKFFAPTPELAGFWEVVIFFFSPGH
jgi:hypothetical protein